MTNTFGLILSPAHVEALRSFVLKFADSEQMEKEGMTDQQIDLCLDMLDTPAS